MTPSADHDLNADHPGGAEQAAVIPIRRLPNGGVEVCLIRRVDSKKWGIPKGFIEGKDDWKRAAVREAQEEAGLDGQVVGDAIGTYEYEKGGRTLTVAVGVMEVVDEHADWPEMRARERRWYSVDEADELLANHPAAALFERARRSL